MIKKSFFLWLALANVSVGLAQVDSTISGLAELTSPQPTDILYVVDDPSGTPLDRKITLQTLFDSTLGDVVVGKNNTLETGVIDVGEGYVVIGENNTVSDLVDSIVIGSEITLDGVPLFDGIFNAGSVAIGNDAIVHNGRCVAIGLDAQCHSVSGTAIGALTAVMHYRIVSNCNRARIYLWAIRLELSRRHLDDPR